MNQNSPVTSIKGIGSKTEQLFHKLDIHTVGDLLFHIPKDYDFFAEPVGIAQASSGGIHAIYGVVVGFPNIKKVRNLTILNVNISDSANQNMQLTFFNMPFLKNTLHPGSYYVFRGLVQTRGALKIMEQPKIYAMDEYRRLCGTLMPRYGLTKGLSNATIVKSVQKALEQCDPEPDWFRDELLEQFHITESDNALKWIHFPKNKEQLITAHNRLAFDEFFGFLLQIRTGKEDAQQYQNAFPMLETADTVRLIEQLPFPLTKAQRRVWGELKEDLAGTGLMNRLIQGDVGSGKTILAFLALLMCAGNGYQGALMAPTEVLAVQHYETALKFTRDFHLCFRPVLLVGSMSASAKKEACRQIASGEANLIIGTHALIQKGVTYQNLALVVTDEQHRFGVRQRETLAQKGISTEGETIKYPHVLVMSATPIPRTLAMILYGDLHISVVDELPACRLPIKNCVVNSSYRPKAYGFIQKQVEEGHQAYVICPQVEEGEFGELENVVDYTQKLRAALSPDIRVAYLHGKMTPTDKNRIMNQFSNREIDVLVSTTVIEVGINVPNATVMMVENAERFGLAGLHQLRGRVGRGEHQSYCIFISTGDNKETMERLDILNKSNDGFYIAAKDLELRGPGEFNGVRQSGELSFRIADIFQDAEILKAASQAVDAILSNRLENSTEFDILMEHYAKSANSVDFRTI